MKKNKNVKVPNPQWPLKGEILKVRFVILLMKVFVCFDYFFMTMRCPWGLNCVLFILPQGPRKVEVTMGPSNVLSTNKK
jgi:hypothetical protein